MFVKENPKDDDSLEKEVQGLTLLDEYIKKANNCNLKIPQVFELTKHSLKLQKIKQTYPSSTQMKLLGLYLSNLHKIQNNYYGLEYDNYIGLSKQYNTVLDDWGEFFVEYRLSKQVSMIKDENIKDRFLNILEREKIKLQNFLNENTVNCSLIHGDLWSGNVLFSQNDIYLIDPAVYFADNEVDIAMTEMFGGFTKDFYEEYNRYFNLSKMYDNKKNIYNLYHYLNHYNLFGNSYLDSCVTSFRYIQKF